MKMKWNHNYFTDKFKMMPEHLQIVCTGTTQAHFALDFSGYDIRAFNMAVWMNYFTYCKLLLEKYQKNIDRGAAIFITLQYPIFLCDESCSFTMKNALQYSKILFGRDPHVSVVRQCIYRMLPDSLWSSEDFKNLRELAYRNRKVNHLKTWELEKYIDDVVKDGWGEETGVNAFQISEEQITQEQKRRMCGTVGQVAEVIELCKRKEWVPILLSLPFSKMFNDRIPEDFKRCCFYRCIDEVIDRTGCRWLDYSQDKRLENINYYMDVWWLNERGRRIFTKIVLDEYQKE